jgi:DNA anti-recombination protein RmuC
MIRHRTRRMTVAHLKERMDQRFKAVDKRFGAVDKRFDAVDKRFVAVDKRFDDVDKRFDRLNARMDAGFASLHEKLNAILRIVDDKYKHHGKIVHNHEDRLQDLESWRRTTRDIVG